MEYSIIYVVSMLSEFSTQIPNNGFNIQLATMPSFKAAGIG